MRPAAIFSIIQLSNSRVHDVNLDTLIGYHIGEKRYNFLDDYDEKFVDK